MKCRQMYFLYYKSHLFTIAKSSKAPELFVRSKLAVKSVTDAVAVKHLSGHVIPKKSHGALILD